MFRGMGIIILPAILISRIMYLIEPHEIVIYVRQKWSFFKIHILLAMLHGLWTPVPHPGIGPTPPALKHGVLTTGPPEKSPDCHVLTDSSASIISSGKNELVLPLRWKNVSGIVTMQLALLFFG